MTDVAVFNYSDTQVRTVVQDGGPWFVARDVLAVLGLSNLTEALRGLDDDEFSSTEVVDSAGRRQDSYIVNEPGLYSLILRSRKPEAKAFKRWVTHEVLPAIRKTGRYEAQPAAQVDVTAIGRRELARMVIEAEDRADVAEQALAVAAPKAEAWEHLASANGDYAVADAAKILSRHPLIKVGRDRLFTLLSGFGWTYRRQLDNRWTVYQRAVDTGWATELATSHYHPRTGELVLDPPQVRITAKGLAELQKRLTGTQTAVQASASAMSTGPVTPDPMPPPPPPTPRASEPAR